MKCIILAAGRGKRLKELTASRNKCSIVVNNQPIIKRLVSILKSYNVQDISIITGYRPETIKEIMNNDVNYIHNPLYSSLGILVSLWLAKNEAYNQPLLLSTADVFFHDKIIPGFLAAKGDVVIPVKRKHCAPKDVKVAVKDGKIIKFEEDFPPEDAVGEFGMMALFNESSSKALFDITEEFLENQKQNVRLIDVFNEMIERGYTLEPYYFDEDLSIEIDTYEDLQKAHELAKKFNSSLRPKSLL